jgi:CO/xanthine dehydrogenase Mo-binding subunit
VEPLCVRLAQKSGRPVQILMSREEEFLAASPAPRGVFTLKTGATRDGRLVARQARLVWDAGAFGGAGGGGVGYVQGPYRIPHVQVDTFGVYTNKASPGAYRAPGTPQINFASESQLDTLARELGLDPIEFRLRNLMDDRDFARDGQPPRIPVAFRETLQKAAEMAGWQERKMENGKWKMEIWNPESGPISHLPSPISHLPSPSARRGIGVALGRWDNWAGPSSCVITINEDGSIKHFSGAVDVTGSDTALAQIVAEELGIAAKEVVMSLGDTDAAPYAAVSAGSRVIYGQGAVAQRAAQEVKAQLLALAAAQLEVEPEALELRDHKVFVRDDPEESITLAELGRLSLWSHGGPIIGRASLSDLPSPPVIAAQIAEVEVDPETGEVRVLRLIAAQDVGCAINRMGVEGQIQGGATQGLGWGLHEAILYDAERGVLNPNLLDYRMPTAADVPLIEVGLVELNSPDGPFGAKGVGEPPIIPTAAALANAIYDAVGVRLTDLPLTAERIALAMRASET